MKTDWEKMDVWEIPCSDCGKKGGVIVRHTGLPYVPEGQVGYFDSGCSKTRKVEHEMGLPPRPLGVMPLKKAS